MPDPELLKTVLTVIGLYENADIVCDNDLIDSETGFSPDEVDEVLDYLWRTDQIECRAVSVPDRNPFVVGIRRGVEGRERRRGHGVLPRGPE
jgi:hypothetical protein